MTMADGDTAPLDGLVREGARRYLSLSTEATQALGSLLGALLEEGDLVILTGDLGAGKTQLTKGVAAAMGVDDAVTSPTFNLMAVHHGRDLDLFHFDLYRLDDPDQLGDAGVLDVAGVEGASLVEWGEDFADDLGDERLDITISRVAGEAHGEPVRSLELTGHGVRGAALAEALDDAVVRALA